MMFIGGLLVRSRVPDAVQREAVRRRAGTNSVAVMWVPVLQRVTSVPRSARDTNSHPRHIELRLLAGAVAAQRAGFADRVGALEDPVLPRRQAREDFRFHGLRSDEAQIGFHAGEAVGREAGALLKKHPDLVVPVDIVKREGDEAEPFGFAGIERVADSRLRALQ